MFSSFFVSTRLCFSLCKVEHLRERHPSHSPQGCGRLIVNPATPRRQPHLRGTVAATPHNRACNMVAAPVLRFLENIIIVFDRDGVAVYRFHLGWSPVALLKSSGTLRTQSICRPTNVDYVRVGSPVSRVLLDFHNRAHSKKNSTSKVLPGSLPRIRLMSQRRFALSCMDLLRNVWRTRSGFRSAPFLRSFGESESH